MNQAKKKTVMTSWPVESSKTVYIQQVEDESRRKEKGYDLQNWEEQITISMKKRAMTRKLQLKQMKNCSFFKCKKPWSDLLPFYKVLKGRTLQMLNKNLTPKNQESRTPVLRLARKVQRNEWEIRDGVRVRRARNNGTNIDKGKRKFGSVEDFLAADHVRTKLETLRLHPALLCTHNKIIKSTLIIKKRWNWIQDYSTSSNEIYCEKWRLAGERR